MSEESFKDCVCNRSEPGFKMSDSEVRIGVEHSFESTASGSSDASPGQARCIIESSFEQEEWPQYLQRLLLLWSQRWRCSEQDVIRRLKDEQVQSIQCLLASQDVILIARTGFGKSLIFHSVSLLRENKTAIIIYPLDALQEDQEREIELLAGAKAFILNHKSAKRQNFKDIADGLYTHVLSSPEILLTKGFQQHVWWCERFLQRLALRLLLGLLLSFFCGWEGGGEGSRQGSP